MEFQHNRGNGNGAAVPPSGESRFDPELARELAHKLGNLLQVVNGNLELLSSKIEDRKLRGYIANAQTATRELTEIARHLADEA